ncbi:MAG: DUF192 domain-containing protein, partial [Nitrosopumilaceae archaeon]
PGTYSMWMQNMQFSLDMIWFDSEGKIVHIEENVSPCKSAVEIQTCTRVNAENEQALYILEVTSGFVKKFGITENSVLEIISI